MKTYKLVFTSSSLIDKLPDSQTIFGAICNVIKLTKGQEALDDYLASFNSDEPWFIHSSMFVEGIFPSIKKNIFDLIAVNNVVSNKSPKEKLDVLSNFKKYKKINGISENVFRKYICLGKTEDITVGLIEEKLISDEQNILKENDENIKNANKLVEKTYRVRLDGLNEKEEEGKLFINKIIFYPKDTKYTIYVKTKKEKQEISNIFSCFNYFALGSKGSIGRNLFKLENCEEINFPSTSNCKMILSKYIPNGDEFNVENSSYSLSLNNYIGGIENKRLLGSFSHFEEGSLIDFHHKKDFYGKIVEIIQERETVYHYGIGFVV